MLHLNGNVLSVIIISYSILPVVEVQRAVWTCQVKIHLSAGNPWLPSCQAQQANQRCEYHHHLPSTFMWKAFIHTYIHTVYIPNVQLIIQSLYGNLLYFGFSVHFFRSYIGWNTTRPKREVTHLDMTLPRASTWRGSRRSPAM